MLADDRAGGHPPPRRDRPGSWNDESDAPPPRRPSGVVPSATHLLVGIVYPPELVDQQLHVRVGRIAAADAEAVDIRPVVRRMAGMTNFLCSSGRQLRMVAGGYDDSGC